jgi:peptidoglycan/xylan/chitin deacetylase (PgdA/CDA1 family)
MGLRFYIGAVRRHFLSSVYSRHVPLGDRGPIVSFTFDDFPRTAYTVGGRILQEVGVRGTFYAALGLMNTSNELGEQFRLDDLHLLTKDGHELGSHTFSHLSCRKAALLEFRQDVHKGRDAIRNTTGLLDSGNFAYPYGAVTLRAKKILGREMISCRGTSGGINGPEVDLNLLRANSLYGDMDQFMQAERLISQNEHQKGWLIFYSHDVGSRPSRFGCTQSLLAAVVSLAAKRGSRIMTIADVLREIQAE